ncbi:MAG: hypothetical protein AB1502_13920 [Thermodesulfobacteriota bacterium]
MLEIFKQLVEIPGGSGFEEKVIEVVAAELRKSASDVSVDSIGNVIGKHGTGKKSVMVCAHMDEVGMLVKYIDSKGYIYFDLNGMIDERILLSTKVDMCTDKRIYTGVVRVKNRQRLIATALKHGIPYQKDIFRTWTDASNIHTSGRGIPCGGVYIPRRYSHSPLELVKWPDVERTGQLLYLFLKELRSADIDDLIRKV